MHIINIYAIVSNVTVYTERVVVLQAFDKTLQSIRRKEHESLDAHEAKV